MDRFVVGTGRCGSTLLSRMLGECPQLLSIFEFFNGLDMTRRFSGEPMSGSDFAKLISQEHPFLSMVLRRGYPVPEIVYPFEEPGSRFARGEGIPYLLGCAFPRMSRDPDGLFDETLRFAVGLPAQPPAAHYRSLFDWWARRQGRELWLERSGSSIDYLGSLRELFPEARFVHLHRDGREAALSMREHHAFRLAVAMVYQVLDRRSRSIEELGELESAESEEDRISRLLESRPDVELFGRFWSDQLRRGMPAREGLGEDRYLEIRFEELVERPAPTLGRIADFFGLEAERDGWIQRAAALIRGLPPLRTPELSPEERRRLDAACRPGMELLGREVLPPDERSRP